MPTCRLYCISVRHFLSCLAPAVVVVSTNCSKSITRRSVTCERFCRIEDDPILGAEDPSDYSQGGLLLLFSLFPFFFVHFAFLLQSMSDLFHCDTSRYRFFYAVGQTVSLLTFCFAVNCSSPSFIHILPYEWRECVVAFRARSRRSRFISLRSRRRKCLFGFLRAGESLFG